jgi:hypothetical protein
MSIDPSDALQLLMGCLLGVVGYMVRQALVRLDQLERGQHNITGRLIRIETKLGGTEFDDVA